MLCEKIVLSGDFTARDRWTRYGGATESPSEAGTTDYSNLSQQNTTGPFSGWSTSNVNKKLPPVLRAIATPPSLPYRHLVA